MSKVASIVDHVDEGCKDSFSEQDGWKRKPTKSRTIEAAIRRGVDELLSFLRSEKDVSFDKVEQSVIERVFTLGRLFLAFFLASRQEQSEPELRVMERKGYSRGRLQPRFLGTFFGKVRYWRTYMHTEEGSGGLYPLDRTLGLTGDGFSMLIMSLSARLATLVSFDQVTGLLRKFLGWSPSKTTVEKAVIGLGKYTRSWFTFAPPPQGDGEVLVIQFDSKATPTATEEELRRRRGKRRPNPYPKSPRHRGRHKRGLRGSKVRRKPGDKSKNGRGATLAVMYTLKRSKGKDGREMLLGPVNRWFYGSYESKRHVFEVARREADKRGFREGSGKLVQIVTDGDEDLKDLTAEFFPSATHTLDVIHVVEYIWEAARCIFKDSSPELVAWVEKMKKLLYSGKCIRLIEKIAEAFAATPRTGPGNLKKRETLARIRDYLLKRINQMNYDVLRAEDLEIASGSIEGGIKHVVGKRFDNGSMRWIRERAEHLLQLRCIEINNQWDAFIAFVQTQVDVKAREEQAQVIILSRTPLPLSQGRKSA